MYNTILDVHPKYYEMDSHGLAQYEFLRLKLSLMEAKFRSKRRERIPTAKSQYNSTKPNGSRPSHKVRTKGLSPAFLQTRPCTANNGTGNEMPLNFNDVISFAEHTREVYSQESRRSVLEEAQKNVRQENSSLNWSRPHSVIGMGLQALTSPMPLSAKDSRSQMQMDHIPVLLPLPSDRTFIPSPDRDNHRHANTPVADVDLEERSQSVARQCCEIMGQSMCKTCRKLERRLLNRERAERECPHMHISQRNITTTQVVKRFYPHLTDTEIQDRIARGQIARIGFLSRKFLDEEDSTDESNDENDDENGMSSQEEYKETIDDRTKKKKEMKVVRSDNPIFALTQLKKRLKGMTSTPLFFTNLKGIQAKILSGEVDRKRYLVKPTNENTRLKSAVSSLSTASSGKSTLSKIGLKLSESLMPVFVSPRKVKIYQEPSYKVYYEPPLLSKRRQIPNPAFFAGSSDAYSLPERLPDIIEFADSKIKALEKQGRSTSSMSFASNISEDIFDYEKNDPLASSRKGELGEREGEAMLGDSLSSSTPRLLLKSSGDVIDENTAGEQEHTKEDNLANPSIENNQDESIRVNSRLENEHSSIKQNDEHSQMNQKDENSQTNQTDENSPINQCNEHSSMNQLDEHSQINQNDDDSSVCQDDVHSPIMQTGEDPPVGQNVEGTPISRQDDNPETTTNSFSNALSGDSDNEELNDSFQGRESNEILECKDTDQGSPFDDILTPSSNRECHTLLSVNSDYKQQIETNELNSMESDQQSLHAARDEVNDDVNTEEIPMPSEDYVQESEVGSQSEREEILPTRSGSVASENENPLDDVSNNEELSPEGE